MRSNQKTIVGRRIEKIFVDTKQQHYLRFVTDSGNCDYRADGDCCSESYFSDVNRIKNIIGKIIIDVKAVELAQTQIPHIESRQDEDIIYGFRIVSKDGMALVIMRNSSNGYYGGTVERIDSIPDNVELFEIKKDFCSLDLTRNNEDI